MDPSTTANIVIIGNGISGVTAARHIRKRDSEVRITIISSETDYFFSRTALMYIFMGHMRFKDTQPYEPWFWKKNRIELKRAYVTGINTDDKSLELAGGQTMTYDKLILALGSTSNTFDWPGQDLPGVQGLYSYQDLELLEKNTKGAKRAVIVGGGLIGVELAEMLHSRDIQVTCLVRDKWFWGSALPEQEAQMISQHIRKHGVDLRTEEELKEIVAGDDGRVAAVITKSGERIDCDVVGLTVGVSPNIGMLKNTSIATGKGVLVNEFLETSQPDVFAVGDCVQLQQPPTGRRAIEAVWYAGRMMGEAVAKNVTGERTPYTPGHWFNSAKFFDIEYQTYGLVPAELQQGQSSFYWEHPDGEKAVHLVFDKEGRTFIGINTFGIRMRHAHFDRWLTEKRTVEYVLEHLRDAHFDPEFYKKYESDIVEAFNKAENTNIRVKPKSWSRILEAVQLRRG